MKRIVIYIDGSNFYFSVNKTFNCKIDIEKFCKKLAGENNLIEIKYFSIIFGRLEKRKQDGKIYFVEKATDVNLALDLVLDAQANLYDEAFLVSNDGDFSGAVNASIKRFEKEITYIAIGNNKMISYHLKNVASKTKRIDKNFIEDIKL